MHLTWSVEQAGRCPACGGETVLVVAPEAWGVDAEDREARSDLDAFVVEVGAEVSGHYCPQCRTLVSVSVNVELALPA